LQLMRERHFRPRSREFYAPNRRWAIKHIRFEDVPLLRRKPAHRNQPCYSHVLSDISILVRLAQLFFHLFREQPNRMPHTRPSDVTFLGLSSTVFCVECELISSSHSPPCLSCGSQASLSLAVGLDVALAGTWRCTLVY